ncbi:MAG: hypothetical protein KBA81_02455 [Rhabdochlamydiaceae bacterium]|nr:hypothetical protein [Rhabdochlamydiaceae bacterium]
MSINFKTRPVNNNSVVAKPAAPISVESYKYGPRLTFVQYNNIIEQNIEHLNHSRSEAAKIQGEKFIASVLDDEICMQMPGVAIIGTYLRRKHGLANLFVCASMEAFQNKLNEISRMKGNIRMAMIVPGWTMPGSTKVEAEHKIPICVEKIGHEVKIAFLDSLGCDPSDEIDSFYQNANDLEEGLETVLHYIHNSSLDKKNTQVYCCSVDRQRQDFGCETFSLKDAVSFLRDPHFFDKIVTTPLQVESKNNQMTFFEIHLLPPSFMKGTQSFKKLDCYFIMYPITQASEELKDDPELQQEIAKVKQSINNHIIHISYENDPTKNGTEIQNHYNQHRSLKYHLILLNALKSTPAKELQAIISETLLETRRPFSIRALL